MKKFLCFICILLVLLSSCSQPEFKRKITVYIPVHRWTENENKDIWYSLVWGSCLSDSKCLFIDGNTSKVDIWIESGKTIFVCAYPLKEMQCYGNAVTPNTKGNTIVLNQNDGFLCDLFLSADNPATAFINYDKVRKAARNATYDFRKLDSSILISDALNGKLSEKSFVALNDIYVEPFAELNGIWISESVNTSDFRVTDSMTPTMYLPLGVHRFYNKENDIILKIVVAQDGTFHTEL